MYHVTVRGTARCSIFEDDADRERYLRILAGVVDETGWKVLAYCLMGNHVHLLILTPKGNLATGMRLLSGTYAQWFNRRHGRVGHLFQGRYGSEVIRTESQFLATLRYIVWNPVRAGLRPLPELWRWSSHRAIVGETQPPAFLALQTLRSLLDSDPERARDRYRRLCAPDALGRLDSLGLGELKVAFLFHGRSDAAAIAEAHASGHSMREIAAHLGVDASTVSRRLRGAAPRATSG
jgi:putative transposase